ncbi:MAG: hypothetical protein WDA59_07215 [Methanofastidiosum sp.]
MEECEQCMCWHCEKRYNGVCSYEMDCQHVARVECSDFEELHPETMLALVLSEVLMGIGIPNPAPNIHNGRMDFPISLN